MTKTTTKIRIEEDILIRYKVFCAENRITMEKQTGQLIESFLQLQKENMKIMKQLKKMGKE